LASIEGLKTFTLSRLTIDSVLCLRLIFHLKLT